MTIVPAKSGTARVALSYMKEILIRATGGVAAILTHKDLGASLAIGILLVNAVNLPHVGLQRAALGEGLLTQLTLVRADSCSRRTHVHANEYKTPESSECWADGHATS